MKNILSSFARSKALILALGVMFALPVIGHADGFKGKFTLTTATHWGTALLTPGKYDFVVDSTSAPTRLVVRDENGKVAAMLITMWSTGTTTAKSNLLELEAHDGATFVSAVYLKDADTELHFLVPKDTAVHEAKAGDTTVTASMQ